MPTSDSVIRIEKFDPARHKRADFSCGVERLDNYLKLTAKKQLLSDMTRVYVVVEDGSVDILGYYTLNMGMMNVDALEKRPKGAPAHGGLPILFLGQVAVSKQAQGVGLGSIMMAHLFEKAAVIANEVGCYAVVLDVMQDGGDEAYQRRLGWYQAFGFQSFESRPSRMFMTMAQVRALTSA